MTVARIRFHVIHKKMPTTFLDAVEEGLQAMSPAQLLEFEQVGFYADPHTKYKTGFDWCVAEAVGLSDGSNEALLSDATLTHLGELHFLEILEGRCTR